MFSLVKTGFSEESGICRGCFFASPPSSPTVFFYFFSISLASFLDHSSPKSGVLPCCSALYHSAERPVQETEAAQSNQGLHKGQMSYSLFFSCSILGTFCTEGWEWVQAPRVLQIFWSPKLLGCTASPSALHHWCFRLNLNQWAGREELHLLPIQSPSPALETWMHSGCLLLTAWFSWTLSCWWYFYMV